MKVSQEIYANTGVTAWNKSQAEDDIYENDLKLETWKKKHNQKPTNSGPNTAWSRCYKVTAVCLLLLCVLLLAAVTVLWIKFNNLTLENNQLQTSYNNLTLENNQLQTSYNNLTLERDQIQQERSVLHSVLVKLGWRRFGSRMYAISTETKSWNDTRQDCIRRGADLVIINSTEEEEFINEYFGSTDVWLGLTKIGNKEEFKWVDGLPQNIMFWRFGKPPNYRGMQSCYKKTFPIFYTLPDSIHEPKPVPNPDPILDSNPDPILDSNPDPILDSNPDPILDSNPDPILDSNPDPILDSNPDPILDSNPDPILDSNPDPILDSNPGPTFHAISDITSDPQTRLKPVLAPKIIIDDYCEVIVVGICRMKLFN